MKNPILRAIANIIWVILLIIVGTGALWILLTMLALGAGIGTGVVILFFATLNAVAVTRGEARPPLYVILSSLAALAIGLFFIVTGILGSIQHGVVNW